MTPITSRATCTCAMIRPMKQTTLEPGVVRVIQVSAVVQMVGLFIFRRPIGLTMSIEVPFGRWLALTLCVPVLLLIYTWLPWWRRRLGRAFLTLALVISST